MATVEYINDPFNLPSRPIEPLNNNTKNGKVDPTVLNNQGNFNYTFDQQHRQPSKYKLDLIENTDASLAPISPISSTSLSPATSSSSSFSTTTTTTTTTTSSTSAARKRLSDPNCRCLHHHRHRYCHRPLASMVSPPQPPPGPSLFQRRHTTGTGTPTTNDVLPDTTLEGRPSVFLFIFVNPLSGDQQGNDLIQLPVQQFRLRRRPHVKVEIHNILDKQDCQDGFEHILWVQNMIRQHQLPPLPTSQHGCHCDGEKIQGSCDCFGTPTRISVMSRHIHVYSAGGDGTVMSVFDMLAKYKIDSSLFFFSCVPFGTGNDFSQVLGWGRTTKQTDILGSRLTHLENLLLERLDHGEAARLDIWQVVMTSHPSGFVRRAGERTQPPNSPPKQQQQQRDPSWRFSVPPTDLDHYTTNNNHPTMIERKMCSYISIGVQGYVGSGFEQRRGGRRWANIWAYTVEGAKWLFYRKFPPITNFISRIVSTHPNDSLSSAEASAALSGNSGDSILLSFDMDEKSSTSPSSTIPPPSSPSSPSVSNVPTITKQPIELVIQNIPHIWGRQIDLWGGATTSGLEIVKNRSGPTDASLWHPQRANDGHLELMAIGSMFSYIKKLANFRNHVSRIGQLGHPFKIEFKPPPSPPSSSSSSSQRKFTNQYERENIICIMCDGEFYEVKDPKEIRLQQFDQIWTLGNKHHSRLVRDEIQWPAHSTK